MSKIKSTHLILVQAALFVLFLVLTSWFNRFAADDYYFIGELNTKSFQEIYAQLYFYWHGRWSSNFLLLTFLELRNIPSFLFIYFLFVYSILFLSIKRLFKQIVKLLQFQITNQQLIFFSIISMSILFFCTINPNETWFWYTSSVVYFWSIIAFIFAVSSYLKTKKTVIDYCFYTLSLIYIGGSNEPLTAFIGFILIYQLIKKKENPKLNLLGLLLISLSFFANYLSPGTLNRDNITPSLKIGDWILFVGFGTVKYLFFTIYKTFILAIFSAIPFYWLGKKSGYKNVGFNIKQQLIYSLLGIGSIVFINQAIVITALGGLSPDRAMISSSVFITFILIRFVFLLGVYHKEKNYPTHILIAFNVLVLIIFNLIFIQIHHTFSKKYDERMTYIINHKKQKIITIISLPFSGYIYNPVLKTDADYFVNQHLKSGLGIESDLILEN